MWTVMYKFESLRRGASGELRRGDDDGLGGSVGSLMAGTRFGRGKFETVDKFRLSTKGAIISAQTHNYEVPGRINMFPFVDIQLIIDKEDKCPRSIIIRFLNFLGQSIFQNLIFIYILWWSGRFLALN